MMVNQVSAGLPVTIPPAAPPSAPLAAAPLWQQIVSVQQSSAALGSATTSAGYPGRPAIPINTQLLNFVQQNWPLCHGCSQIDRVRKLLQLNIPYRPEISELQNVLQLVDADPPLYHTIRSALIEADQQVDHRVVAWVRERLPHCTGATWRDNVDILMMMADIPAWITRHSLPPALVQLLGPTQREAPEKNNAGRPAGGRYNLQIMAWVSRNWPHNSAQTAQQKLALLLSSEDKPRCLSLIRLYPVIKRLAGAESLRKVDIQQALIRAGQGINHEVDQWVATNWFRVPQGAVVNKILTMLTLPRQPYLLNPSLFYASLYRLLGDSCPCFSSVGDAFRLVKRAGVLTPEIMLWVTERWRQTQHKGSQLARILTLLRENNAFELDEVMLYRALLKLEHDFAPSLMSVIYAFGLFQTRKQFTPEMHQWVTQYWAESVGLPFADRVELLLKQTGKPEGLNSRLLFGILMTLETEAPDWHTIRDLYVKHANQKMVLL